MFANDCDYSPDLVRHLLLPQLDIDGLPGVFHLDVLVRPAGWVTTGIIGVLTALQGGAVGVDYLEQGSQHDFQLLLVQTAVVGIIIEHEQFLGLFVLGGTGQQKHHGQEGFEVVFVRFGYDNVLFLELLDEHLQLSLVGTIVLSHQVGQAFFQRGAGDGVAILVQVAEGEFYVFYGVPGDVETLLKTTCNRPGLGTRVTQIAHQRIFNTFYSNQSCYPCH